MPKNIHRASNLLPGTVCGRPLEAFLLATEKFHGNRTPGILLGGMMVDWALELLALKENLIAVSETKWALPDAIQLFTPCTIGNGRLIVLSWGKMGLSLFSQKKYAGYRIWLDLTKTKRVPSIYNWHMHLTPPHAIPQDQLLADILNAGRSILSWRAIPITRLVDISQQSTMAVCSHCNEAYPEDQGDLCLSCQGNSYYEIAKNDAALH
jgi:formylmethanofuran dehydrogenase subunit E